MYQDMVVMFVVRGWNDFFWTDPGVFLSYLFSSRTKIQIQRIAWVMLWQKIGSHREMCTDIIIREVIRTWETMKL